MTADGADVPAHSPSSWGSRSSARISVVSTELGRGWSLGVFLFLAMLGPDDHPQAPGQIPPLMAILGFLPSWASPYSEFCVSRLSV